MKKRNIKREKQRETSALYKVIQDGLSVHRNALKQNPTEAELVFKKKLDTLKIRYVFQKMFYNRKFKCIPDFFIKTGNVRIVIEVDGGYHLTKTQQLRDVHRETWLRHERMCEVIRFTNDEVMSNIEDCIYRLADLFLSLSPVESFNKQVFAQIKNNKH